MHESCTGRTPRLCRRSVRIWPQVSRLPPLRPPGFPRRQRDNRLQDASNTLRLCGLSGLPGRWAFKGKIEGRSDGLLRNDREGDGWKPS